MTAWRFTYCAAMVAFIVISCVWWLTHPETPSPGRARPTTTRTDRVITYP